MTWLVRLQQKADNGTPRYFTGEVAPRWVGNLTTMLPRAATFPTESNARVFAEKLALHPWGPWVAEGIGDDAPMKFFRLDAEGDTLYFGAGSLAHAKEKFTALMGEVPEELLTWSQVPTTPKDGELLL